MWNEDRIAWLALAWFSGFGSKTIRKLRQRFHHDGARSLRATRTELLELGVTEYQTDAFLRWRDGIDPKTFARRLDAEEIRLVLPGEDEYPALLAETHDPPQQLFVRGNTLALQRPVAVVGTRAMTPYGARVTRHIVTELVAGGCDILSGLALGIDATAHACALDARGHTIAILAGGINADAIYPRQNLSLATRLLNEGGSIISELPPGTESLRHLFPLRNRIIAALSIAVIVVEAAESSGSLLTAKIALDQNREVFAVPGPITSEQSRGTNTLISLGATPLLQAQDVLGIFQGSPAVQHLQPPALTADEQRLLELLGHPTPIDDLIRSTEEPPATVTAQLAMLELQGCVERQGAQLYVRTPLGTRGIRPITADDPLP
jgi:DNA processing protein